MYCIREDEEMIVRYMNGDEIIHSGMIEYSYNNRTIELYRDTNIPVTIIPLQNVRSIIRRKKDLTDKEESKKEKEINIEKLKRIWKRIRTIAMNLRIKENTDYKHEASYKLDAINRKIGKVIKDNKD